MNETKLELKIDGRYTLYELSSFMACTVKREITIKDQIGERYTFAQRKKRKKYYLNLEEGNILIEGWDLPLLVDSDTNSFCGNACYNFLGTTDYVKKWLKKSLTEPKKGCVLAIERFKDKPQIERVVYLEEAKQSGHAVVNRILDQMEGG